jgi:Coenzyme PQQ synthesis protein D (PqqD)
MEHPNSLALTHLAVSREGFAFDPTTGESYTMNPTAAQAMAVLAGGGSAGMAAAALAKDYEIPLAEAERDIADFVSRLKQFGLLV